MTDRLSHLCDLLYFDFEKTSSLYSQLEGGLLTTTQTGRETGSGTENDAELNVQLARVRLGRTSDRSSTQIETRQLHHDLLIRTHCHLFERGLATDLNQLLEEKPTLKEAHESIAQTSYVQAEGWALFEDYDRLKRLL